MNPQFHPAMNAAYAGDLAAFREIIIRTPALVTDRSSCSHPTLLQFVAVDGGLGKIPRPAEFAQVLIVAGAALDEPLVAAASVNAREVLDTILAAGASVEAGAPWTALEEALYWGHMELATYLWRERGATVRSLRVAAGLGLVELVDSFFDSNGVLLPKADPVRFPFGEASSNANDVVNQAFFIALKNLQYDTAAQLLAHGAEVSACAPGNHEQCSPLHLAAGNNNVEMVDWLLVRGADVSVVDGRFNATAAGWARYFGHDKLAEHIKAKAL